MSYTKWTPGPWSRCGAKTIVGESGHGWFVRVSDKRVISVEGRTCDEADANANLIAAAPELYEALDLMRETFANGEATSDHDYATAMATCDEAQAKARGES